MDDWRPGDLALCLKLGIWHDDCGVPEIHAPEAGRVYTVAEAIVDEDDTFLVISGFKYWWLATFFRKIRPHTPDTEDIETIALLNGAPVLEPVSRESRTGTPAQASAVSSVPADADPFQRIAGGMA